MEPPSKGTVLLYAPQALPTGHPALQGWSVPPFALLALAGPLRQAGYTPRIVDGNVDPVPRFAAGAALDAAVAVGISTLTGHGVTDSLAMAGWIRERRPDLPIIWGGWHPTFVAAQAALDPRVDFVVRGQGEQAFPELLDALRDGRSVDAIRGLTYRAGEQMVETPDRGPADINGYPPHAWDLIDPRTYIRHHPPGVRHSSTILSRGCPYRCDFCLDSRTKWIGLSLERMQAELSFLVDRVGVNDLRLYDGNFFLGRERMQQFARMVLASFEGKFTWQATGVANRMIQLDGETLDLLHRAGCRQVALGAETGSEELLSVITNKTTVAHTIEAVRLLTRHGINQYVFFMVGFPEEPPDALDDTMRLIAQLKAINPSLVAQVSFCVPLPGSRMFDLAAERGLFKRPAVFADWGPFDYTHPNLPHITTAYEQRTRRFLDYVAMAYPPPHHGATSAARRARAAVTDPFRAMARWRVTHGRLGFPVELTARKLVSRLMPASRGPALAAPP